MKRLFWDLYTWLVDSPADLRWAIRRRLGILLTTRNTPRYLADILAEHLIYDEKSPGVLYSDEDVKSLDELAERIWADLRW